METEVPTLLTRDETTLVETLVRVDGTTWAETDDVTLDMTGKTTLFETDATEAAVEGTVVTVALSFS